MDDYKKLQEMAVTGHNGGSFLEILLIISAPLAAIPFAGRIGNSFMSQLLFEFLFFFVLPLLCVTFVNYGLIASAVLWIFALVSNEGAQNKQRRANAKDTERPAFLTVYRSMTMIYTCLAILAVDFPLFPRRFVKVETYGISLMDIGTGSIIFSQGLVHGRKINNGASLISSVRSSIPLLLLGLARLLFVKSANYQEHVSEYGVHWNFFFTLALLSPFVSLFQQRVKLPYLETGLLILAGYEIALRFGLEDWINHAPRLDLLSANKEGVCSFIGYLGLFFVGASIGTQTVDRSSNSSWGMHGFVLSFVYVSLTVQGFLTSRRMVNSMFVLGVTALNLVVLSITKMFQRADTPFLLNAVNRNQFSVFLVANLLTGLINMNYKTLFADDLTAFLILIGYAFLLALFSGWLHYYNIKIKFW
ncbi:hypothetical protein MP638_006159 [Amoeboaphelidium occidentale]|nr:hypothetical protein MP638_006159 [Amoeboaphelidium occidentale]